MSATRIVTAIASGIAIAVVAFLVVLLLIKALWAWTIPDLFPGAVEQGLIARSISWWTAAKVALLFAVVSAFSGSRSSSS